MVKLGRSVAVIAYFRFSKWRPSTHLGFGMMSERTTRFVFDGPNIVLKLHVDLVYTLQDIVIFIFGLFGLNFNIRAPLGEFVGAIPPNEIRYCHNPQKDRPWAKTRCMSKSIRGFELGTCLKKYSITK